MPQYDYRCRKCGKAFAVTLTMGEHEKKKIKCPKCASKEVSQQISSFFTTTSKKS